MIHLINRRAPTGDTRKETQTKVQTIPSAQYLESNHSRSFFLDYFNSLNTESAIATSDRENSTTYGGTNYHEPLKHQLRARYFSGSTPPDTSIGPPTACAMLVQVVGLGYIEHHH